MRKYGLCMVLIVVISVARTEVRHIVTSDSVDLYVTVAGTGKPCLYIHGGPGSGSYWLQKFSGPMLEKHLRMIYLDQRGVGRSTSPKSGDFSTERMVKDFEEVRKALGIEQWLTMGHSFGGILQMQYALRYPDAVMGMIMLNCTLNITESGSSALPKAFEFLNEPEMKRYMNDSIPFAERLNKIYGRLREKHLFWEMGYALKASEDSMNASFAEISPWNHDYENVAMAAQENWEDFKPLTPGMHMPVLFFYGKTDWMVGPEHYRGVKFPRMILWGSNVGHMPFLENKEDLEKAIVTYVTSF